MQLTRCGGLRYECSGAVLKCNSISGLSDKNRNEAAIFTERKFVLCSGPPSVYRMIIGGMLYFDPCFLINAFSISTAFLKAVRAQ